MKFTLDWLKDYLDTNASADEIAQSLTNIGLEIDDVITESVPIVAKIIECADIPDTKLKLCMVDDGTGVPRQIVCGGHNARAGLVTALALPGTKIGDMEIKVGKIRGHESHGMLCSERELGLGDDHDGIIELPEDSKIGKPITNHQSPITIFEAGITPNRPDYLAVRGIALDLSAVGIGNYKNKDIINCACKESERHVIIENTDACPIYDMCEIHNIKMAPSNTTIARRLSAIGINPRNACVDATNYISYDIGQPMHCFDADKVRGDIIIRNAKIGEKFTDLFGAEHELVDTDLVIADSDGILALAGIIGGERSGTTDYTKNIILESAYFDPVTIRRTRTRLKISTDASYRYERGIDPTITEDGIKQARKIIMDECAGEIVGTYRAGETPTEVRAIEYNPLLFQKMTGIELAPDAQRNILQHLKFDVEINGDMWTIIPVPARVDILLPENIVSEIMRIYGYDNIKTKHETRNMMREIEIPTIKSILISRGLTELMSFGFGDIAREKMLSDAPNIQVQNPIASNMNTVRNSLVENALNAIADNCRYNRCNLNLFEMGVVFTGNNPGEQHDQLIIARTGVAGANIGARHGRAVSIYDVRADLLSLFPGATVENGGTEKWMNPYRAGHIVLDGQSVAVFAELHPVIAREFGIKTNVVLGVVEDVSKLEPRCSKFDSNSRTSNLEPRTSTNDFTDFPLITRDFAFVVGSDVNPDDIIAEIKRHNSLVYESNIFDIYDMGDKKSIAFELVLQPSENLSDKDLTEFMTSVIELVESKFDAKIRDK